ncbi:synaptotagmin-3 isoform X2 [Nymphaea colorata]|uniref:synaptotagmin-3 isoform X2 n=1 Tax=Nymphaea colorata TaxID=210225 RepID=UPI00129D9DFF|nr:synaptotagmin-3 isoform X2 [Nymphaea colorata]
MGFWSTLLGALGFSIGIPIGLLAGYFFFIYRRPADVKDPYIKPVHQMDSTLMKSLLPFMPFWVKNPDYDRAICNIIRSTVRPIFDEYVGKFHVESIKFDQLTLGTLPPTIHGIKVYDTNEKVLVFEPAIRWAGNPNITVALKASCLRVTTQLIDMQIFVAPRITLKPLVPSFPCFASIIGTLMEKPHIDFGLKVMGGDIMAIPRFYRFIQEMIKDQIASLYLWPKILEIPILDISSVAIKKPIGILHVKVVRAVNLRKMDILGKSDPYVKMRLSGESLPAKKTTVKMCNLNPVWNEQFRLIVKDLKCQVLELHVFDWEKVGFHDKLGMQVVPLSLLVPNEKREFTLDLLKSLNPNDPHNKRNRGQITLELNFVPFKNDNLQFSLSIEEDKNENGLVGRDTKVASTGGLLSVWVQEAKNVEGKHHTNPYALVIVKGDQKRTKVIKKSRAPNWNEEFQFMLEEAPTRERVHIEVMSRKKGFNFHWKEPLGHVDINLVDVVNNGRINEKYHLINSKNGVIHIEMRWKVI